MTMVSVALMELLAVTGVTLLCVLVMWKIGAVKPPPSVCPICGEIGLLSTPTGDDCRACSARRPD